MSDENLEITNSIPSPDPAWDYYILWHSLHHIKAKIDAALNFMKDAEYSTSAIDEEIQKELHPASDKLIEILNQLPVEDDE